MASFSCSSGGKASQQRQTCRQGVTGKRRSLSIIAGPEGSFQGLGDGGLMVGGGDGGADQVSKRARGGVGMERLRVM